ncbi:MAG: hypothetical protein JO359_15125, partial [Candidatus Eremiobacteraeota bacterium]|nr:hypothetical protein [Candidatus Eremiobacteraeota bacterium]
HALEGPLDSAVSVHFARERTFDPVDLVLLRSITMHLGLALANARLFETERHARRRAEMLERNLRAIRGVQGESAILRFVTDTIVAEFGACGSAWSLRDGHFRCESASARKEALAPSYAVGTSVRVVSRHLAALQGEQVVLTRDEPELWSGVASKQAMIAPLFVEDRLWGFLSARIDLQPTATDEDRANFLRSLAAHTALAIANAHAMEKHRRYANERAALSESARTILTFNDPEALAATMTRIVLGLVGADRAEIYVPRDGFLRIVGSATFGGDAGYGESASEHMRVTLAYASGGTAVEDDGHTAIFALPSTDHVAGVLAVYRNVDDTAPFDENDIRLLESFSALLGLGLRNCELFEAQSSANAALRLSSEFKDDLLAMFTHDFKGPLTVIMGYAELLMERLSGEPRNDIATIYAQADRLVKLADDTMRLAQAQTAGFAVERESCDLAALLEEAIDGLGSGRVELVGSRAILALRILADRPRLLQALQNVIGNALKYSSERVQVRLEAGLGRAVVAVVDRGIGISTEDQSRIFARFARGRNAREQGIAGTGIGLYITRKIVEAHGGTIEVKSEEGQGSTFTISLPTAVGEHGTALGRRELTAPA